MFFGVLFLGIAGICFKTWIYGHVNQQIWGKLLLMEEILHQLGCKKPDVNNGINYQPQLVNDGFLNHQPYGKLSWEPKVPPPMPPPPRNKALLRDY